MTNDCRIVLRDGVPFRETPRGELYSVTLLECGAEIEHLAADAAGLQAELASVKANYAQLQAENERLRKEIRLMRIENDALVESALSARRALEARTTKEALQQLSSAHEPAGKPDFTERRASAWMYIQTLTQDISLREALRQTFEHEFNRSSEKSTAPQSSAGGMGRADGLDLTD